MVDLQNLQTPQKNVYKLPDNVSDKEGFVKRQFSKKLGELFGDTVAIFGAGPIGLLTTIAAKAAGASKIFVFDLSEERLNKSVGATHTINSGESNPSDIISKYTDNGVDVAFEVAGVA